MYCPSCLNDSLHINTRGVVHILVNGRQRDTGRFLYNIESDDKRKFYRGLEKKLDEFFQWLSGFSNQEPIKYVQLCSNDFACDHGCKFGVDKKFSVINVLVEKSKLEEIFDRLGEKYMMKIELHQDA